MTCDQVIAEAAAAEREATSIWTRINAASDAMPACPRRGRPIIPHGMEGDAQRAGDFARSARALRAEAADLVAVTISLRRPDPLPAANCPLSVSPAFSLAPGLPRQGAGTFLTVDSEADLDAIAKRIACS